MVSIYNIHSEGLQSSNKQQYKDCSIDHAIAATLAGAFHISHRMDVINSLWHVKQKYLKLPLTPSC